MDETKNKYILYFINVFISGLVYSFMTSKLLSLGIHNSLIIIFIASVVDLVITYDTKKSHHFEQISPYIYSLISLLVFLLICLINSTAQWFYLIVYSYLSFFFSIVTLFLQTEILDYEQNVKLGFLNMQFMRSASKMIGFLLGILLEILSNDIYFLSILFLCFFANTIGLKNLNWSSNKKIEKKVQLLIKEKKAYILLGVFSTATVLWIPLLTGSFNLHGLKTFSWIPFVLPGIFSMGLIHLQKKYRFLIDSLFMEYSYIPLIICFFVLRMSNSFVILQSILFSIITALSLSLSIKVRKYFLMVNDKNNNLYLLQTLSMSSSVFSLVFSMLGGYRNYLESILLIMCIFNIIYMIIKKENYQ